jgi:S1-C subfamily serine protease
MTWRLRLMAALLVTASPAYAQRPNPVFDTGIIEVGRLNGLTLRGPGSQIGVSTRDRVAAQPVGVLGVLIDEVRPNSPASRAGLMKGDIVIRFDGHPVGRAIEFSRLVAETPPGWTVRMRIVRNGKTRDIAITPTL